MNGRKKQLKINTAIFNPKTIFGLFVGVLPSAERFSIKKNFELYFLKHFT